MTPPSSAAPKHQPIGQGIGQGTKSTMSSGAAPPVMDVMDGDGPPRLPKRPSMMRLERKRTFSSQDALPRLPIPSLEETLDKFPRTVCALQSVSEQKDTERLVSDFLNGDGPKLQALLEEYEELGRENGKLGSYVEEFWSDAYLAPDDSVVLNLNPFFVLEDGPDAKKAKDQILRAASLVFSSVKLASVLRHEKLAPDVHKGKTLCMDQFKALFGASRVPKRNNKDCVEVEPDSTHIVVMERNQMYYFQALWPDGTVAVTESDIVDILQAIKKDASSVDLAASCKNALGVLTTLPRNLWAVAREDLMVSSEHVSSEHNRNALEIVDSALFVLVLDNYSPCDIHDAAANMLHGTYKLQSRDDPEIADYQAGTCCNRWYDKLQIIVCANGTAGINFEHSAIDGHTALRFVSDIFADTVVSFAQSITKLIYGEDRFPSVINADVKRAATLLGATGRPILETRPKRLTFQLPSSIVDRIYFAETALSDQIVASDTYVLEFKSYGKNLITSNKMSPDSFVQMSILLAYYELYGNVVCQYEPVLTKAFFHGRTEAMRSATSKAALFCQIWTSRFATKEEKLQALREATQVHSAGVKQAAGGKGVDRHLFALKCIAERNNLPIPEFFESEPYRKLNHTVLSTSNCGNPSLRLFGFGPVVPDGFGIGYIIKDEGLQYSISSKHRQTKRYSHALNKALLEIGKMLKPLSSVEVEEHLSTSSRKGSALEFIEGCDYYGETDLSPTGPPPTDRVSPVPEESPVKTDTKPKYPARVIVRRGSSLTPEILQTVGENVAAIKL